MADEGVEIADGLTPESFIIGDKKFMDKEVWERVLPLVKKLMSSRQKEAHAVRGFVLLRRGKNAEAARELTDALQPVIEEVEERGISRHELLRTSEIEIPFGLPTAMWTPLLWLAELYETLEDYESAYRFLLASWYQGDQAARSHIRVRLRVVYQKMGYAPEKANRALEEARSSIGRYLWEYNHDRPHRGLRDRTPREAFVSFESDLRIEALGV